MRSNIIYLINVMNTIPPFLLKIFDILFEISCRLLPVLPTSHYTCGAVEPVGKMLLEVVVLASVRHFTQAGPRNEK